MSGPRQPRKTLRADASALVEACAGWNSRLAARRITQYLDRAMTGSGLTAAQLGLMALIAVIEDDTLGAISLSQRSIPALSLAMPRGHNRSTRIRVPSPTSGLS